MSDSTATSETETADENEKVNLKIDVTVTDVGPCKKHVSVKIPHEEVERYENNTVGEVLTEAEVPGFRVGHVPKQLIKKRFKSEIADQVKQKLLIDSLEQLSDDHNLDPISQPNLDLDNISIPESGEMEYEFDIEVRPQFDIPDFEKFKLERPVHEVTDEEVNAYKQRFLAQYGELVDNAGAVEDGDYMTLAIEFLHDGKTLNKSSSELVQVQPTLKFEDAEILEFDKLMEGAAAGDVREADVVVASEAESIELRGETIHVVMTLKEVRQMELPQLDADFMERIDIESEEDLDNQILETLERQMTYQQRQSAREQIREKILESANWDLPEDLVLRQVQNAMRREVLEMQQAGFTQQEIRSRQNDLRSNAVTTTRESLKEHFILDKVADQQNINVDDDDIDTEIMMMAYQQGENPRRFRAQLEKNGMMENLGAQLRERKAIDYILNQVEFVEVDIEPSVDENVEALQLSVCGFQESEEPFPEAEATEAEATEAEG